MDRSGDSTSQAGKSVEIQSAKEVYLATNLNFFKFLPVSHKDDASKDGMWSRRGDEAGCGCESLSEQTACRWTQTQTNTLYTGLNESVLFSKKITYINMYVNEELLSKITRRGEMFEEKLSELAKALCRFSYDGDMPPMDEMTAVKIDMIKVKDGMKKLMEEFGQIVSEEGDKVKLLKKLIEAVKKCEGALVVGVDVGCLVFIFKHSSLKDKKRELKALVCNFLPDWVNEEDLEWEFRPCAPDEGGVDAKLSNAIQLMCPQSVPSVDSRLFEKLIEKKIEPYISSIHEHITKTREEVIQRLTKQHQDVLQMEMQTFLKKVVTQLRNLQPYSSDSAIEGIQQSRETFAGKKTSPETDHLPGETSSTNLQANVKGQSLHYYTDAIAASASLEIQDRRPYEMPGEKYAQTDDKGGRSGMSHHGKLVSDVFIDQKQDAQSHRVVSENESSKGSFKTPAGPYPASDDIKEINKKNSVHGSESGVAELEQDSAQSGDEPKVEDPPPKSQQSKTLQAEQLLNWVNVKSKASQSDDQEIQRMMEQVELSLQDEDKPSPRARALDTVLVLDTSDSVVDDSLDELKTVVHTFIDGIETNVDTMNLEENLAVVQISGRSWVRQHLTNDYNRIRDAVDEMTPESKTMPTGGRTPMFQALLVCLGAIEGRGGVVNVAGCHRVRPRLIFFSDGRPTDEAMEMGGDMQSNVNEVKFALVQLITEFASKKHKTTPAPIFWVPVGKNPDMAFLESLATLSGGKVVPKSSIQELCRYYKVQETIGCVYKVVRKHKDVYSSDSQIMTMINALAGNVLETEEKEYVLGEVQKKQKEPDSESTDALDFDNIFEDEEDTILLRLGTRVRRGPNWKWNDQDSEGAGTVVQHRKKRDGWLRVMWDNGNHNAYRCGDGECFDVREVDEPRLVDGPDQIDIGVRVIRGDNWKNGDEDGHGKGIVLRKRRDNKVKVRWENGYIGKYKFDAGGSSDVKIDPLVIRLKSSPQGASASKPGPPDEQGGVGGADQEQIPGPGERYIWEWKDPSDSQWRQYNPITQDKLLNSFNRGVPSCIIERDKLSRRVLFKHNQEKPVDGRGGGGLVPVKKRVVSNEEYLRMSQRFMEETSTK